MTDKDQIPFIHIVRSYGQEPYITRAEDGTLTMHSDSDYGFVQAIESHNRSEQNKMMKLKLESLRSQLNDEDYQRVISGTSEEFEESEDLQLMFDAVKQGQISLCKRLLNEGKVKINEPIESLNGYCAIHIAARWNQPSLLRILIEEYNADTLRKSSTGRTAVHYAVQGGSKECFSILHSHHVKLDEKDNAGKTPLDLCILRIDEANSMTKNPSLNIDYKLFNHQLQQLLAIERLLRSEM